MKKDVPSFRWPTSFSDGGKVYRTLLKTAVQHSNDQPAGAGFHQVLERMDDLKQRLGVHNVDEAAAIAFAYLGHLAAHGIIPPLEDGMYM